jgi:hypothetical protein
MTDGFEQKLEAMGVSLGPSIRLDEEEQELALDIAFALEMMERATDALRAYQETGDKRKAEEAEDIALAAWGAAGQVKSAARRKAIREL